MRATLKELLDKLGVGYILSAYETCPWAAYDDEQGISCNAEVRMNNDADEIEAARKTFLKEQKVSLDGNGGFQNLQFFLVTHTHFYFGRHRPDTFPFPSPQYRASLRAFSHGIRYHWAFVTLFDL